MAVQFPPDMLEQVERTRKRYPTNRGALLPTLWLAQAEFGHLTPELMEQVADLLELPPCQVVAAATFYTLYRHGPPAKCHLQICTNVSCMVLGGYDLLHHTEERLGIRAGQATDDNLFRLDEVECLASCGTAPALQVNDRYEENLTAERIDALIEEFRQAAAQPEQRTVSNPADDSGDWP
jgi:NADH-quinone oxidoreductase E subunit